MTSQDPAEFTLIEPAPELPTAATAHAAAMRPSATAAGIAYTALAIGHSDVIKACAAIRDGRNNDAIEIIREARTQLDCAENMLTGRIWEIPATHAGICPECHESVMHDPTCPVVPSPF